MESSGARLSVDEGPEPPTFARFRCSMTRSRYLRTGIVLIDVFVVHL